MRSSTKFLPQYLDWLPTIQDISHQIRRMQLEGSGIFTIGYILVTLLIAGLVWFIFYSDSLHNMPESPPDEPLTESQLKELGLGSDQFDYQQLIDRRREMDETVVLNGSTDKYDWQQTKTEIDVWMPLPEGIRSKNIKVDVHSKSLVVSLAGDEYLNGELYDTVVPDECNWQIDTEGEKPRLWLTMQKKNPSVRNQFWTCLLLGDPTVDTRSLGPSMIGIDPSNPKSFKDAIAQVKNSAAASQRAKKKSQ